MAVPAADHRNFAWNFDDSRLIGGPCPPKGSFVIAAQGVNLAGGGEDERVLSPACDLVDVDLVLGEERDRYRFPGFVSLLPILILSGVELIEFGTPPSVQLWERSHNLTVLLGGLAQDCSCLSC